MRKSYRWIAAVLFLIALVQPLWAKDKNTVAVLPFSVHSAENIDYVRQGIEDMLASRISVNEKIGVIGRDLVLAALQETAGREIAPADAFALGKKLSADFVGHWAKMLTAVFWVAISTNLPSMLRLFPIFVMLPQTTKSAFSFFPCLLYTSPSPRD